MGISWPYCCNKICAIFFFTKVIVFNAFFIYRISFFYFYTCVYNGNQSVIILLHFFYKFIKITKILFIKCKIFKIFHIINIHIYHINRNMMFSVFPCDFSIIFFCFIPPSTLCKTKCKFWRNVTSSYELSELFYNIISAFAIYYIEI